MSGIFPLNIALTLVSIAVIPIMAFRNAPSLNRIDKAKAEFSKKGGGRGGRGECNSGGGSAG
jgi:hypothetical protein